MGASTTVQATVSGLFIWTVIFRVSVNPVGKFLATNAVVLHFIQLDRLLETDCV